jgi:hypothetical protein
MTTAMQAFRLYLKENHNKLNLDELLRDIDNHFICEEKSMLLDFYIQNNNPQKSLYQQIMDFEQLYKFYLEQKAMY